MFECAGSGIEFEHVAVSANLFGGWNRNAVADERIAWRADEKVRAAERHRRTKTCVNRLLPK